MISANIVEHIEAILNNEKADEILGYMMKCYAFGSVRKARKLLEYSNEILDIIMQKEEECKRDLAMAINMLMNHRAFEKLPGGCEPSIALSMMLPVCKTMFPDGRSDCKSIVKEKYYNELCDLLSNKRAFDWKNDEKWAAINGYTDYIKMIEKQEFGK